MADLSDIFMDHRGYGNGPQDFTAGTTGWAAVEPSLLGTATNQKTATQRFLSPLHRSGTDTRQCCPNAACGAGVRPGAQSSLC